MKKSFTAALMVAAVFLLTTCAIFKTDPEKQLRADNEKFLKKKDNPAEVFKILITSESYIVSQVNNPETIKRQDDPGGDKYICDEIKKFDIMNEAFEGVFSVDLYPDLPGRIMKIRPKQLFRLMELQKLITDDVQRWNFDFPKKVVIPNKMEIRYRIVLRKKLTDDEIIKQIQSKMKETQ